MRIVGPKAFTVGVATSTVDPAASGGNPSIACQIQNSSSYQLLVNAGGAQLSIQPFWAQTVEISGQPITIQPESGTGSGTAILTLAFLLGTPQGNGAQLPDGTWVEAPPQDDGSLTAAAIEASNPSPSIIFGPSSVASGAFSIVPVAATVRTLLIRAVPTGTAQITQVLVEGVTTGFAWRSGAPYLGAGIAGHEVVVVTAFPGAIEPGGAAVSVVTSDGSPVLSLEVLGDSAEYTEAIFYNGPVQAFAAGSSATLVAGPVRLLTVSCEASAAIVIQGQLILNASANNGLSLAFPENTILPFNQSVTCINQGAVTYAYP